MDLSGYTPVFSQRWSPTVVALGAPRRTRVEAWRSRPATPATPWCLRAGRAVLGGRVQGSNWGQTRFFKSGFQGNHGVGLT
jgi:hypothetical protein